MPRSIYRILGCALFMMAVSAQASFHTFVINEIFSNADGTIQFIELREAFGASGQNFLGGHNLTSSSGADQKTFTFNVDLPSSATAGKFVLIGTNGFAALGLVTPDYVVPDGFLFRPSGSVNFAGVDAVSYTQLPADGTTSINRNGVQQTNSPRNFAGLTATIPAAPAAVIEFYNTILDNYFITADPVEAHGVDIGGAGPGWTRTGGTFKPGGPNQVCRFYGNKNPNPATGNIYGPNSHFYTVDATECNGLKTIFNPNAKSWGFESNDFNATPAAGGTCSAGLVPVYRAYNNGFPGKDSNHRITTSLAAIQEVVARGWINEGIVMCAQP